MADDNKIAKRYLTIAKWLFAALWSIWVALAWAYAPPRNILEGTFAIFMSASIMGLIYWIHKKTL